MRVNTTYLRVADVAHDEGSLEFVLGTWRGEQRWGFPIWVGGGDIGLLLKVLGGDVYVVFL